MKKDSLTKPKKKSIMQHRSALSFNKVFVTVKAVMRGLDKDCTKGLRRISRRMLGYFVSFFNRRNVMKMTQNRGRFATALVLATLVVIGLTACGGGGGGGGGTTTPPPVTTCTNGASNYPTCTITPPVTVTQTVTCPDGTSKTGTGATASLALDAATAQCLAPTLVSITPADKATGVSPDTIATNGIVVATSSTLTTPAISDITLQAGTVNVPVTVTMTAGGKGFKFVPNAKLLFAQLYSGIVKFTDTLGKNLSIPYSFMTASVSCTAPLVPDSAGTTCVPPVCPAGTTWSGTSCEAPPVQTCTAPAVWTASLNTCVSPIGVKMSNPKTLPLENGLRPVINGPVWKASIQDGSIQFFDTGLVMTGYRTDTLVMAFFIVPDNGSVCSSYLFKADGSGIYPSQGTYSCKTGGIDWVVGTADGHIMHVPSTGECYKNTWNQSIQNFEEKVTACPF